MNLREIITRCSPKAFYQKYYKKKLFNKLFFVYLLITIVANLLLFSILSQNLTTIKYQQTIDMSNQILTTVDGLLENKITNGKSIHQKLIQDTKNWDWITSQLRISPPDNTDMSANVNQTIRKSVIATVHSIDSQINGVYLSSNQTNRVLNLADLLGSEQYSYFPDKVNIASIGGSSGTRLISGRMEDNHTNSYSLFMLDSVSDPNNFTSLIGTIVMRFDGMNIRQSYRRFDPFFKGKIYIFDEQHNVLFDSTAQYKMESDFPFDKVKAVSSSSFITGNQIYNYTYNSYGGYYIVNIIPRKSIIDDVHILQGSIFKVMILVILLAILFTYLSTKLFSARLKVIKDTMESVKQGHLTNFKKQKTHEDEVGFIYTELINMCSALDDHIQMEYVYKLKQKEMELYTLQAQINPHFLYNSLESIRMNLHLTGETEASKMIQILSEMFRNIMKQDVVVGNRDEINYVSSYLELYKFRFGKRIAYKIDVANEVYSYATIKHILQPIVENALVHGISGTGTVEKPAKIRISACKQGDDVIFTVADDGIGIDKERLAEICCKLEQDNVFYDSIGIYNVNSRLKIVYGADYRLVIKSKANSGTEVTIRIKAMLRKELESYVQGINR